MPISEPPDISRPIAGFPSYREQPPSPELAPYVECYWTMTSPGGVIPSASRVLPDGCIDIIVDLGAGNTPRSMVVGAMRQPIIATMAGPASILGVRFLPGGARRFLPLPMRELTDRSIPLDDLRHPLAAHIEESAAAAGNVGDAITAVDEILRSRLRSPADGDPMIPAAVELVRRSRGAITVRELEGTLGVGRRHLERRFNEWIGLSPKLFARIIRFQRSTALLRRSPAIDWQDLVLLGGYFDQAHLIREFRELAGLSPGGYRRELASRVASVQCDAAGER